MLWAEVVDQSWSRREDAEGPILLTSVSVSRVLNGAGSIQIELPSNDERALRLLEDETRVKVFYKQDGRVRQIGAGILQKDDYSNSAGNERWSLNGPDALQELKHYDAWLGRIYRDVRFEDVVSDLVGQLTGVWQATVEEAYRDDLIELRIDGGSVLLALQELTKKRGLHLRQRLASNDDLELVVEVGRFGTETVLECVNPPRGIMPRAQRNDEIAFIENLRISYQSEHIVNYVVPTGNGTGDGVLDLRYSDREGITPFVGPGGNTLYAMMDTASIARYGVRQKTITFEDISILVNSPEGKRNASNMLADATRAYLNDNSQRQVVYQIDLRKVRKTIQPGDLVNVSWRGMVKDKHGREIAKNRQIDGAFYVLRVNERVGAGGEVAVSLEISNIPNMPESPEAYIVNAVEKLKASIRRPMVAAYWSENTYQDYIQGCNPSLYAANPGYYREAKFKLEIDNLVTDLKQVRIRFKTKPLITPLVYHPTSAGGGDTLGRGMARVLEGYNYPNGITLWIDDVDVSAQFGGPWSVQVGDAAPTPWPRAFEAVDVALDITDLIVNSPIGMYGDHSIIFKAAPRNGSFNYPNLYSGLSQTDGLSSNGIVELNIRVRGICQT
jgi:rhodanese-related sulfurtransferase